MTLTFCRRLLEEEHAAVTPGRCFGDTFSSRIRLAVCGREETSWKEVSRTVALHKNSGGCRVKPLDVLLVTPPSRVQVYQELSRDFAAIETACLVRRSPYLRQQGCSVAILDAGRKGSIISRRRSRSPPPPGLAVFVIYGQQPSASTQCMPAGRKVCEILGTFGRHFHPGDGDASFGVAETNVAGGARRMSVGAKGPTYSPVSSSPCGRRLHPLRDVLAAGAWSRVRSAMRHAAVDESRS